MQATASDMSRTAMGVREFLSLRTRLGLLALLCGLSLALGACKGDPPHTGEPDSGTRGPSPDARTADGSGGGVPSQACGDLVEGSVLTRWSTYTQGNYQTTLSALASPNVVRGSTALRAVTQAPFDFALIYTPATSTMDVSGTAQIRFALRGLNTTPHGWQGKFPVVVLQDSAGQRRTYTPTRQLLPKDGTTWVPITLPLAGDSTWTPSGASANLAALSRVEIHADTWDAGFTVDVDALSFEKAETVCTPQCPNSCSGRGTCDAELLACTCNLGYGDSDCSGCAPGFVSRNSTCVLPHDGTYAEWPNPISKANSDAWLQVQHAEIQILKPRLLALNFVNKSKPARVSQLINRIIASLAEGSRVQGFKNASAPVQFQYQLARPIIDMRDGVNGRPRPPAHYRYENSTLFPRRPANESGGWKFDYATLFEQGFARYYGYPDPANPRRYLTLCELVERGDIHELWIIGSGDVPDVNAAEVLEAKPRYTRTGNRIPDSVERCAGNGCFDADVPICGRSLRIGFVNYNRGPGCYVHSHGHGLESVAAHRVMPALTEWFSPLSRFDLDTRYHLPISSWYGMSCTTEPCLSFPRQTSTRLVHQGATYNLDPYDAMCGNVHFPPNGVRNYDYANATTVLTSCEGFGRHLGPNGTDALSAANKDTWARYLPLAPDCGGEFLVWWYQNMPGYNSGQTFSDGRPMPSVWPYFFY